MRAVHTEYICAIFDDNNRAARGLSLLLKAKEPPDLTRRCGSFTLIPMPNLRQKQPNRNPKRHQAEPIFSRPPLAHMLRPDEIAGYFDAYDILLPIFEEMPPYMQQAAEDAARDARLRAEVIG